MTITFQKQNLPGTFTVYDREPPVPFLSVKQVHGTKIVKIDKIGDYSSPHKSLEADGMVIFYADFKGSKIPDLSIKTADCLPILLLANNGFAFLHGGRRGIQDGILQSEILNDLKISNCFIGPSIRKCCYQVGSDIGEFFKNYMHGDHLDLQSIVINQLYKRWPGRKIVDSQVCTCCSTKGYYSFRRDRTEKRNFNLYRPQFIS